MTRELRAGRVFVDWSQNDPNKSLIGPYSLRAARVPLAALPLRWTEVEKALERRDPSFLRFDPQVAKQRIARFGDLFERVLTQKQHLLDKGEPR